MSHPQPSKFYREDPDHVMPPAWLDDETYAAAIASFIIVCTDAMIIDPRRKTVWLAQRKILPMRGFWVIGGRRYAAESTTEAVQRCFIRETSLKVPGYRFGYVRQNEYLWSTRQQVPQNVGSHNMADTFTIELTSEERDVVARALAPTEYETVGLQEFDRQALVDAKVHRALIDLYDSVF